jgi:hypothetical protein
MASTAMLPCESKQAVQINDGENDPLFSPTRPSPPVSIPDSLQGLERFSVEEDTSNKRRPMGRGGLYDLRYQNDRGWKQWTHVKVKVSDFKVRPSTWEVYQFLAVYGTITSIDIDARGEAYVVFW